MRSALLLSVLALGATAQALNPNVARHGDDDDDMDMDMGDMDMMGGHHDSPVAAESTTTTTVQLAASTAIGAPPAATTSAAAPVRKPHDPHNHNSHAKVKEYLDDEDIHYWHKFPPTYLDADFRLTKDQVIFGEDLPADWPGDTPSHPGLMITHVGAMMLAYFALLPISLALRAAGHPSHYLVNTLFIGVTVFGWVMGLAYKAAMPDMYEGAKHGFIGTLLVFTSIGLAVLDSMGLIHRAVAFYRSGNRDWKSFFHDAYQATQEDKFEAAGRYEMVGLRDDMDHHVPVFELGDDEEDDSRPASRMHRPSASRHSTGSDGTLQDTPSSSSGSAHNFQMGSDRKPKHSSRSGHFDASEESSEVDLATERWAHEVVPEKITRAASLRRTGEVLLTWVRRTQVVIAYVCVCTAIPTYVGMCRAGYINTCAAHIIKGSIFFGYGVLTFARYLGAYADLGWAWNAKPAGSKAVSAEMIECAVIFTYGITNTWMERFGSHKGDPYTVKQVQHISIAVMFWFGGLSGILLESKRVRRLLSSVMLAGRSNVREPSSYSFSFNPIPALVIAITGLAMAAHHQDYKFQVEIHSLWGILLAGGSMFRFLTYFFLWLRPPTDSTLPSRPPTEMLTAFGWAAGGIVFMLSTEEISFAAMRAGFDDMMAFLNLTVALTCLVFCWIVVVLAVKGYALTRVNRGVQLTDIEV